MEEINLGPYLESKNIPLILAGSLVFARLILLLALPLEGLQGYGDIIPFYLLAQLPGWPFFHYWVEFPPLFPFLIELLFRLAGGQEHVFTYLLIFLLLLADAGSIYLFSRLAARLFPSQQALPRALVYLLMLIVLVYSWWYFDPLAVFLMLLGLVLVLEGKVVRAGSALGLGVATKFFPALALLVVWQRLPWRKFMLAGVLTVLPVAVMYAVLWLASPDFTAASLHSQESKGSWETIWALLDGNIRTGSFGRLDDRFDPIRVTQASGNPAVIPPLASLIMFAGVGLGVLLRLRGRTLNEQQSVALVGFGWGLFALWSPGWSPQWVLYLLPLILLALPMRQAVLLGAVLILVNLLEWPVLLSRGFFWGLWLTIPLRFSLLLVMTFAFYQVLMPAAASPQPATR